MCLTIRTCAGLARRGVHVPADTVFVACQHDTTTDAVTLDKALIPASHAQDVVVVEQQLAAAGRMAAPAPPSPEDRPGHGHRQGDHGPQP
ncbi:MAG: putative inorganic carbon transporter subunit DabA [Caldilineaceae bacterium]